MTFGLRDGTAFGVYIPGPGGRNPHSEKMRATLQQATFGAPSLTNRQSCTTKLNVALSATANVGFSANIQCADSQMLNLTLVAFVRSLV